MKMKSWIDEDNIRFDGYHLQEQSDDELLSEEEYHLIPQCAWCDDAQCPGAAAHYDAGE